MRRIFLLFLFIISICDVIKAQVIVTHDSGGFYRNSVDYRNNKLSRTFNLMAKNNSMHFSSGHLVFKIDGQKIKIPADSVYAFFDYGKMFRIWHLKDYVVENDTSPVLIYSYTVVSPSRTNTTYFYSLNDNGPIKKLNKGNLLEDFSKNPKMTELLNNTKYWHLSEKQNGEFIVNNLYRQSQR